MNVCTVPPLPYDLKALPREQARHYIPATDADLQAMCETLGLSRLEDLYRHIPPSVRLAAPLALPEELGYFDLYQHLVAQSQKNRLPEVSFLGDALPQYSVHELVPFVASLRELLTAYTPYQPERSQGTLMTQWLYQSCLVALTGFEAINASQYDRSTALVEALYTAARLSRWTRTHFLLLGSLRRWVTIVRYCTKPTLRLTFMKKFQVPNKNGGQRMSATSLIKKCWNRE